ncbi:MAG TPA: hypothetical protein VFH83_06270 [Spirochaetia bacterium]|nr:hypothetical protein [Spirochaetia bacterium]
MRLWQRRDREEDPQEFWKATAEKRGGAVGFTTFATLLGSPADRYRGLPGLLYTIGDSVWFEDFERDNWFSRIVTTKTKFEKTEMSFQRQEVRSARLVSRNAALRCIAGGLEPDRIPTLSRLGKLLHSPAVQVRMNDGSSLFLEVMRAPEFVALFASP